MFTKENILKHTKILLVLLIFHFVWTTFIKYQLWLDLNLDFLNNNIFNLWKDFYLIFIYALISIYAIKNNKISKLKNTITYSLVSIIIISLLISLINFQWVKSIVLWFKYDIWFLFPIFFYSLLDITKKDLNKFYDLIIYIIKIVISLSLLFAIIRFTKPELLQLIWYWPIWDWTLWTYPPMLYQTWFDGTQRISGIFSWPNHLAFYFIAFGWIILLSILNKKLDYKWWIAYLILLFWSLSRSWILAFGLEIFILSMFVWKNYKYWRKYVYYLFTVWFILVWTAWTYLFVSWKYKQVILRWASTKWHIDRANKALAWIKQKPLIWHWLGTAWPASHYTKTEIVPESWFLQIFYEIWILWWFVWFYFIFYLIYKLYKKSEIKYPYLLKKDILFIWTSIWLVWLLFQWLVLHSFEDAMIVIPLFILIWILLAYNKQNDTKN